MNDIEILFISNPGHQMYATLARNKKMCLFVQYMVILLPYKNGKSFLMPIFVIVKSQNIHLN